MEEETKKKIEAKTLIVPLVSVGLFMVLIFAAGYAYFTSTVTNASATYQINLPKNTGVTCSKTDCGVTVSPAMMLPGAKNNTAAKTNNTCAVTCTCSGSQGATCSYSVTLAAVGTAYSPTANLGSGKEFTVQTRLGSGCSVQNSSTTETQVNTLAGKVVATCSHTIPANGNISSTVYADFRWYNVDLDQTSAHKGKTYKYSLTANVTAIG